MFDLQEQFRKKKQTHWSLSKNKILKSQEKIEKKNYKYSHWSQKMHNSSNNSVFVWKKLKFHVGHSKIPSIKILKKKKKL